MYKNILFLLFLTVTTLSYAADNFNKNLHAYTQQKQNAKVVSTFKQLIKYYQNEDEEGFFSLVDKDNFIEDFMLFEQAIEKDFRTYEIVDFDYWIEKITNDGSKKYLYVKWNKKYTSSSSSSILSKKGYSRLLFEQINGKYKLIQEAGSVLFGDSIIEWKHKVSKIAI